MFFSSAFRSARTSLRSTMYFDRETGAERKRVKLVESMSIVGSTLAWNARGPWRMSRRTKKTTFVKMATPTGMT